MGHAPVAALRKFIRARQPEERCEQCGAPVLADHVHQLHTTTRRVRCVCDVCAITSSASYKTIPKRILVLPAFQLSDAQWTDLMIPIALAFFSYSTAEARIVAFYPGPAGVVESTLRLEVWDEIASANPSLDRLESDVEALLVNRVGATREYFIVPVDECYKLVGLIRVHWRGLSGGPIVWGEISRFFEQLKRRGQLCPS
jgi:hypothetical protein